MNKIEFKNMKIGFAGCSGHFGETLRKKYDFIDCAGYRAAPEEYIGKLAQAFKRLAYHSRLNNGGRGELEVTATVNMLLENEILASVNVDYLRPSEMLGHGDDRIRFVGGDGIVEVISEKVLLNGKEVK